MYSGGNSDVQNKINVLLIKENTKRKDNKRKDSKPKN